jgi:hypothetical protein
MCNFYPRFILMGKFFLAVIYEAVNNHRRRETTGRTDHTNRKIFRTKSLWCLYGQWVMIKVRMSCYLAQNLHVLRKGTVYIFIPVK